MREINKGGRGLLNDEIILRKFKEGLSIETLKRKDERISMTAKAIRERVEKVLMEERLK